VLRNARVWLWAAGLWLLVCAVAHGAVHVWVFVLENGFFGMREFAMNAMKQAESSDPLNPTLWRQFRMFSVSFALLLAFTGAVNVVLAWTSASADVIRSFSLLGTVFWTVAFGLFAFVDPVLQGILVAAIAVPLHGIAYVTAEQAMATGRDGTDGRPGSDDG
jgi:hypothetical protein